MIRYLLICFLAILLFGCTSLREGGNTRAPDFNEQKESVDKTLKIIEKTEDNISSGTTNIETQVDESKKEVDKIDKSVSSISNEVDKGKKKSPELSEWNNIKKETNSIGESSKKIDNSLSKVIEENEKILQLNNDLSQARKKVDKAKRDISETEEAYSNLKENNNKLEKENKSLKNKIDDKQYIIWIWLMAFCGLTFGAGAFMLVFGQYKLGASLAAGALLMFGGVWIMSNYAIYIAIASLVVIILVTLYITYDKYCNENALEETVSSMEELKKGNWQEMKDKISKMHSGRTKDIINKIKVKRKLK